jgi:hypothetical protein
MAKGSDNNGKMASMQKWNLKKKTVECQGYMSP